MNEANLREDRNRTKKAKPDKQAVHAGRTLADHPERARIASFVDACKQRDIVCFHKEKWRNRRTQKHSMNEG